jgi:succinyl-CoA synthetase beta subunit
VTDRQYKAAVKAHQAYETAVVDGGQGGNIVYTFGLVTGTLDLVYQHQADPAWPEP